MLKTNDLAAHTPGPLPVPLSFGDASNKRERKFNIYGAMGRIVATAYGEGEAQAIVRACNAHDDLLAALEAVANHTFQNHAANGQDILTALQYVQGIARAAIAKAQP